ncbi:MAG TPA: hypothetical protein VMT32_17510 [Bryobacteraceae bacterium]|nr:hypothetical protein [Bryobacteraceae bacterium]
MPIAGPGLLVLTIASIALLLFLILVVKLHAFFSRSLCRVRCSITEQCLQVAPAMHHSKNQDFLFLDAINDDIFTDGKAA